MIVLTVKTLDSQNHTFTVDDDITVEQFKAKIADTVNIPAETQRIIYCGRVLQDDSKLSEYDVNGKVVHLVQRAPPSQSSTTSTRSSSPQPPRRGFRGFDNENTMYLGSMAFPSNLMEASGVVPPPPTHSLAGSRLNVARRMLRRAEAVINLLENPAARPNEQANSEEQQDEEVTPIIEARVIVPPGNSETIDEAMVLSAVQNTLFDAGSIPMAAEVPIEGAQSTNETPTADSSSSSPEEGAQSSAFESQETNSSEQRNGVNARSLAENASRTHEMSELLITLNQLQVRFAPFLLRYREFMAEDSIVPQENVRQTQAMLSRVSEVLHFLGHAYHSLSDIIIRVRTPPPRPLLCRPILIQHSAVVQTGIPIQVEAQFNLSAERPNTTSTSSTTNSTATTTTTAATATDSTTTPSAPPPVNIRGFPFIPGASMRVQSFPIEVRATTRPVNVQRMTANNNNNNTVTRTTTATTSTPTATNTTTANTTTSGTFNIPNFNNSSVEFFMEVTPEVLQGTLNGPPPEFLQSLVQMAGQIMNRITTTDTSTNTTSTTQSSSSSANETTSSQPQSGSGQTSQARGNTTTNPTTATHTRSTARPHVHLAQQAMQGGFDPFLPCNSHHIMHRRRNGQQGNARPTQQQPAGQSRDGEAGEGGESRTTERQPPNLHNLFDELYSSLRTAYRRREGARPNGQTPTTGASVERERRTENEEASGSTANATGQIPPGLANLIPNLQSTLANLPSMLQGHTIADILQQLPFDDGPDIPGRSIITDFLVLMSRHLTIVDMITLNSGNFDPLNRVRSEIESFFNTRILDGVNSAESVKNGVNKIIEELQPFFQNFSRFSTRDDIDMVRSVECLFRKRLPSIITSASNLNSENMRSLIEQCFALNRMMFALAVHTSANGEQGVEDSFQQLITSYMQGIPVELQNWTTLSSRTNLRHFISNVNVPQIEIQPYIIYASDISMVESEPMDTDDVPLVMTAEPEPVLPRRPQLRLNEDSELPSIVLGSASWHGQVPDNWVPIITRDVQRQRRQNTQPPFSDAYLSGMPTKRRKIVNGTKPQGSLPQVISDNMRRAVTTTGLASAAPLEIVSQRAGESADVQAAYRHLLRSTVQNVLRDNEDFTPERFPNASTYFKPQ